MICGPNTFEPYVGKINTHSSDDIFDIAIGNVSDSFVEKNPEINFIDVSNYKNDFSQYNNHRFLIMGLPLKKNKKPHSESIIPPPEKWGFMAPRFSNSEIIEQTQRTWTTHLFMAWDNRTALDPEFNEITPFALKGMSGGAIFDIGSQADIDVFINPDKITPQLVGIFTDHIKRDSLVFGTKLATIVSSYTRWDQWPK